MEKHIEEKLNSIEEKQNKYIRCALEQYIMPNIVYLEKSFKDFKYIYYEKGYLEVKVEDDEQYYVVIPYKTEEFRTSVGDKYNSFHEVLFAIWSLYNEEKQVIVK